MEFSKALDSPYFEFSLLLMACFTLPVWLIIPLPLPPILLENPFLPLSIMVDCCRFYQPWYLLDICTSTVGDIFYLYIITSGSPYLLFGASNVLSFFTYHRLC